MKYNPKLGMWGNVDKALKAVTNATNEIFNTKTKFETVQEDTDALLVDQEYRLTLLELGLVE